MGTPRNKRPVWISNEAHDRLKAHCAASGRDMLTTLSRLILAELVAPAVEARPALSPTEDD